MALHSDEYVRVILLSVSCYMLPFATLISICRTLELLLFLFSELCIATVCTFFQYCTCIRKTSVFDKHPPALQHHLFCFVEAFEGT
ncbi:hypothetical protein B0H34DRAFT_695275, partial [Crassisporium funariophilum]